MFGIYRVNVYRPEQDVVAGVSKKDSIPKAQESNHHRLSGYARCPELLGLSPLVLP